MRITADTNILVGAVTEDHAHQSRAAQTALKKAELVAIPTSALCELVWVLSQGYKIPPAEIAEAIRRLMNGANAAVNRPAAEAGLALLDPAGCFSHGASPFEGTLPRPRTLSSLGKKPPTLLSPPI